MTQPLVVLRPEPGLGRTLSAAQELGLPAIGSPLFEIQAAAWEPVDPGQFDGILAGSANAFEHGGPQLEHLRRLPVHAVGDHTAQAARACGFTVAGVGEGGLQAVLDRVTPPARLLRLAGEARVVLDPPPDIAVTERVVYRAVPLRLTGEAAAALATGAVVLLHSAEAAKRFMAECDRLAVDRGLISLAALGARIAAAAGPGWQAVAAADRPTDDRLLAIARSMCH